MSLSLLELGSGRTGQTLGLFLAGVDREKLRLFLPAAWLLGKRVWCGSAWWPRPPRPEATCLSEKEGPEPCFARTPLPPTHHQSWERGSPETSSGQAAT